MSEPTTTTPATTTTSAAPAEPVTTTSIIEASIADHPDRDTGDDLSPTTGAAEPTASTTASTAPVTQEEVDELAKALGIDGQGKGKWTARVAYSKLHKVIKDRDAKAKADHEAALKQHTDQLTAVQQQIAAFDQMVSSPEHLLAALAQVNPAYARFRGQPATPQSADTPQDIRTMADLQRVIDQQVAQRLAPIEQEREARQYIERMTPVVQAQIVEAHKWPGFTESQAEILAELGKNPKAGLKDAYLTVCLPKLAADKDKVRQEVLAELNARPRSTTTTSTVPSRGADKSEPQDTQDIIRRAIAALK